MIFRLDFKVIVKALFWFDNDFEIESKYHRKIVVLFLKARILNLQDVVFRSMFFLIEKYSSCIYLAEYLTKCPYYSLMYY